MKKVFVCFTDQSSNEVLDIEKNVKNPGKDTCQTRQGDVRKTSILNSKQSTPTGENYETGEKRSN
jgi:hypothetical protein